MVVRPGQAKTLGQTNVHISSYSKYRSQEFRVFTGSNDFDGNENVKKTIGFISKTTTLHMHHAFLYTSLPVFARVRREHS